VLDQTISCVFSQDSGRYNLIGCLDRQTVPAFWSSRESWIPSDRVITFDLSALSRVDSAGMVMLLHAQRQIHASGLRVQWINLPEQLVTLMTLSHVNALFCA
jgi:phospholipid transport system transporter-binding protein